MRKFLTPTLSDGGSRPEKERPSLRKRSTKMTTGMEDFGVFFYTNIIILHIINIYLYIIQPQMFIF